MPVNEMTLEDLDELASKGAQINVNDGRIVSIDYSKEKD